MSVSSEWDATPRREELGGAPADPVASAFDLGLEQFSSLSIRKPKNKAQYFKL